MEDVLDVYTQPYDPLRPLVCLDETSKQLVAETRTPVPTAPGQPARFDYEYERRGVCALFMLCEPLAGWREVSVSDHRGRVDFAHVIKHLVDDVYPHAEQIRLVMDNLNTHSPGSSTPTRRARCTKSSSRLKPSVWPTSWRSITRQSTGVGSTWPRSS